MTETGRLRAIESCLLSTWPALTTLFDGTWVIRMAGGYTGRANSVTCLDPSDGDDAALRLNAVEAFYRRHSLRPTIRVTPLTPTALVRAVEQRGYREDQGADILFGTLPDCGSAEPAEFEIFSDTHPDDAWLDAASRASERADADRVVLARMMAVLGTPARFVSARDDRGLLGVALAAVHGGLLTFHHVATYSSARRQGVARALMQAGFRFAQSEGVSRYWVFVVADNTPAQALYRGFGAERVGGYKYMRADA